MLFSTLLDYNRWGEPLATVAIAYFYPFFDTAWDCNIFLPEGQEGRSPPVTGPNTSRLINCHCEGGYQTNIFPLLATDPPEAISPTTPNILHLIWDEGIASCLATGLRVLRDSIEY